MIHSKQCRVKEQSDIGGLYSVGWESPGRLAQNNNTTKQKASPDIWNKSGFHS